MGYDGDKFSWSVSQVEEANGTEEPTVWITLQRLAMETAGRSSDVHSLFVGGPKGVGH